MPVIPLALTVGDPAGVGPELVVQLLARLAPGRVRPVVFGDRRILELAAQRLGLRLDWHPIHVPADLATLGPDACGLFQVPWTEGPLPQLGVMAAAAGRHALAILEATAPWLRGGQLPGVVTAPIAKEAIQLTHPDFIGHTEFYAAVGGSRRFGMLLVVPPLRALHVTTHVALREVPDLLTPERLATTIDLAAESLVLVGEPAGTIAVCGLNPHAGEAGHFGREELEAIAPAVAAARARGHRVVGPLPPDTVFTRAMAGEFQVVVCMYHDQGHIPLKLLGFDRGINVTVGLPFVRTSVDHGTAFDLAGTGKASVGSLRAAWELAATWVAR